MEINVAELILKNNGVQLSQVLRLAAAGSSVILEAEAVLQPYLGYCIRKIAETHRSDLPELVLHPDVDDRTIFSSIQAGHGPAPGKGHAESVDAGNAYALLESYCKALTKKSADPQRIRAAVNELQEAFEGGLESLLFEGDSEHRLQGVERPAERHVLMLENADHLFAGGRDTDGRDLHDFVSIIKNLPRGVFILLHDPSIELPAVAAQAFSAVIPLDPVSRDILWENIPDNVKGDVVSFMAGDKDLAKMALWQECSRMNLHQFSGLISAWIHKETSEKRVIDFLRTSRPRTHADFSPVKRDDIGGYYDVRRWLEDYLIVPYRGWYSAKTTEEKEKYLRCITRGICLEGDPGTGKTLIARWLATELAAYLEIVNAASVRTKFVGDSEAMIRQIFEKARINNPSIIVFDEFDAIASQRLVDTPNKVDNSIVNQLLAEMSGLSGSRDDELVIVVTTTNMWAAIDMGIRSRPERIGERLPIGNPCLDDLVNENDRETWADNERMDSLMDVFLRRFPHILSTKLKRKAIESTFKEAFSRICSGAGMDGKRPIGLSCDEIQDVFRTVERQIILKKPDPEAGDVLTWANARIGELQARRLMDGTRSASAHAPETY